MPLLDLLDRAESTVVIHSLLQLVNQLISNQPQIQSSLCMFGGIPTITKFASAAYSKPIRLEAAKFMQEMCMAAGVVQQMFIACQGIPVSLCPFSLLFNCIPY